jgi:hypothetical protein
MQLLDIYEAWDPVCQKDNQGVATKVNKLDSGQPQKGNRL